MRICIVLPSRYNCAYNRDPAPLSCRDGVSVSVCRHQDVVRGRHDNVVCNPLPATLVTISVHVLVRLFRAGRRAVTVYTWDRSTVCSGNASADNPCAFLPGHKITRCAVVDLLLFDDIFLPAR